MWLLNFHFFVTCHFIFYELFSFKNFMRRFFTILEINIKKLIIWIIIYVIPSHLLLKFLSRLSFTLLFLFISYSFPVSFSRFDICNKIVKMFDMCKITYFFEIYQQKPVNIKKVSRMSIKLFFKKNILNNICGKAKLVTLSEQ